MSHWKSFGLAILAVVCLLGIGASRSARAATLVAGPLDNLSLCGCDELYWIDQSAPVFLPPIYQIWGNLLTVPNNVTSLNFVLYTLAVLGRPSSATVFNIVIYQRSGSSNTPTVPRYMIVSLR
jgi:hypothetical protein